MKIFTQPLWFIAVLVATFSLFTGLLLLGSRGNEIGGVVSTLFAILTFLFTFVRPPGSVGRANGDHTQSLMDRWRELSDRSKILWNAAVVALLGAGAAAVFFLFVVRPSVNVTDLARVNGATNMESGKTAALSFSQPPPARDYLTLTVDLANRTGVGNCVVPALMEITPVVDGKRLAAAEAHSGEAVSLPLENYQRTVSADIELRTTDPACRLDLTISSARFDDWGQ